MSAPALQARVHRLLGSRAELEATKTLLQTIVPSHSPSTAPLLQLDTSQTLTLATLRRTLRASLENQHLTIQVGQLDIMCEEVDEFLKTTKRETQQVQTEASALVTKREKLQQEGRQISSFLSRYQLNDEEVQALFGGELADKDMDVFFRTMERVQQVKADCKTLVSTSEINCGFELLDAVSKCQEAGLERLYQWTMIKCAQVDGEPSNELHRAIVLLSDRTEYYNYCKGCLTASRRSIVVRRFLAALTVGGPNGIPRPIEMHAHDPVRYCGDMLAWIHQAIAAESEIFRVLFDGDVEINPCNITLIEPSDRTNDGSTDDNTFGEKDTDDIDATFCLSMVGHSFDGVAKPLQVRVEQTLSSSHGIVTTFKLVHLLAFYYRKLNELISHSKIARALQFCREAANEAFRRQLQQVVNTIAASAHDYAASLAATHITLDATHHLVALLDVSQTSLLPEKEREADVTPLFESILPALELMCQRSVTGLDPVDALVFRINNFNCLHAQLSRFPDAAKWYLEISRYLDCWLRNLSELHASRVMDRCQVSTLLQYIRHFQQNQAIIDSIPANTPGLDGTTITRVMGDFCSIMMALILPQLDQLAQPELSDKVRTLTSVTLASAYALVYEFVFDAKNGYNTDVGSVCSLLAPEKNRRVVLQHTPEEIRTVLELDEDIK
ncbi:conserved oligomeric golgi complex subunit [Plasmopara halstedii]|uniref:Conserved oligomeric Golgi complex subunit 6 n=1 Tax=Plasmopara halstedii TaxID=4781 RepID=A0A0P1B242_PLAHL|nr:conserved oligomeric golgi complex subunit [Plasmopara halstedii]CEG48766.1 conserved oligomeric golgi complex subunit [Plasmopara halstedii]|eukprot:XP_024585135.1 conserved oligomeric golgi complex subunit [Plasmopara halstedii]